MTITLVLPQPPAYSETFFNSKIKGLQESGNKVILVTASTSKTYTNCKHKQHPEVNQNTLVQLIKMVVVFISLVPHLKKVIKYIQLEKKEGTSLKRILEKVYMNSTLLKLKTYWLHFGFATMAIDRELVAKAIGAKMGVSLRGYDMAVYPLKDPQCYNLTWKKVNKVHSISKFLYDKALTNGLRTYTEIEIIHPAVDISKVKSTDTNQSSNKIIKLITVARLHWVKGIDDLIETAFLLKQAKIDFEWQVIGDVDTEDAERYLYHVFQKGLKNEVKFLGKQTHQQTIEFIKTADIYLQTSLSEGFCNAVLEAQALGKLCVAYHSGGIPENIIDKKTGFIVTKGKPQLLAKKIKEVLDLSETEKHKIQKNAQLRVQNEFNLEKQKVEFNLFYEIH